ncbi:MAG: squalene--hopene cyclase [Planctomycetaceae bacterium]|nr:squalene--hopene cyclase [Planctomycetaceae bacterium]
MNSIDPHRLRVAYEKLRTELLAQRTSQGHWVGELSTSALSTATAVMALEQVARTTDRRAELQPLIDGGLNWLSAHRNDDGGWGDTVKSLSNISTTMLAHAVFHATQTLDRYAPIVERAKQYIDEAGGVAAVHARYGKDRTFSIPILTHCALAGLVDWKDVLALPFELACLPARFYKTIRLPVVSYALPALIAIGQVRHHHRKPLNPIARLLRRWAIEPSLRVLTRIQPSNGGFLEAAPLTSFVTMSLAAKGLADHSVARKGVEFLRESVLEDGSWPIDTNLATWVTTLSVNALGDVFSEEDRDAVRDWLLEQQYREVHPYTNADPGGWAWTDLPGGVPDADDTPGALLALMTLRATEAPPQREHDALKAGVVWLLDLQNGNGGWPTFCRGWGALPFDRSGADLTAHVLRALRRWLDHPASDYSSQALHRRATRAIAQGFRYLARTQREDGSWLPLWFGNQLSPDDENPVYGTSRVLAAYRDCGELASEPAQSALSFLESAQNDDGGWGGTCGTPSSNEETSLASEILLSTRPESESARRGTVWLLERIEADLHAETTPIGFYFAKLWYFERLYPLTFMVAALRRAVATTEAVEIGKPKAESR